VTAAPKKNKQTKRERSLWPFCLGEEKFLITRVTLLDHLIDGLSLQLVFALGLQSHEWIFLERRLEFDLPNSHHQSEVGGHVGGSWPDFFLLDLLLWSSDQSRHCILGRGRWHILLRWRRRVFFRRRGKAVIWWRWHIRRRWGIRLTTVLKRL